MPGMWLCTDDGEILLRGKTLRLTTSYVALPFFDVTQSLRITATRFVNLAVSTDYARTIRQAFWNIVVFAGKNNKRESGSTGSTNTIASPPEDLSGFFSQTLKP